MAESTSGVHHKISPSGEVGPVAPKWQDCLASPTPFNLLAFAITAMINGMAAAHWIDPVHSLAITLPITLFLGGFGMVLGALLEWIKGNTFGFTVFGAYGFYYISYAMSVIFPNKGLVTTGPADAGSLAGFFWMFLLLSCFLFTYTLKKTGAFTVLFAFVLVVFALLAIGYTVSSRGHSGGFVTIIKIEGYIVMVFALLGFYLSIAEINSWYPYPTVVIARDPLTGEAKSATVTGVSKTSTHAPHPESHLGSHQGSHQGPHLGSHSPGSGIQQIPPPQHLPIGVAQV